MKLAGVEDVVVSWQAEVGDAGDKRPRNGRDVYVSQETVIWSGSREHQILGLLFAEVAIAQLCYARKSRSDKQW